MTRKKLLAACGLLAATTLFWFGARGSKEAGVSTHSFPAFQQEVLNDNVRTVTISRDSEAKGMLKSGAPFTVSLPPNDSSIYDLLYAHGVAVEITASRSPAWLSALIYFLPIPLVIGSWLLFGFLLGVGFYWGLRWSRRFTTGSTTGGL